MAKYKMCSVLDMVAQQYGRPFFTVSEGSAIRSFADEINKGGPDSTLASHPADFQLFLVGTFDDDSCQIDLLPNPQLLVQGAAVAAPSRPDDIHVVNSPEPAVGARVNGAARHG